MLPLNLGASLGRLRKVKYNNETWELGTAKGCEKLS